MQVSSNGTFFQKAVPVPGIPDLTLPGRERERNGTVLVSKNGAV
jgi:hypothetical protein